MLKKNKKTLWKEYGNVITKILNSFIEGTDFNVKVCENGLLYGGNERLALTWMNVFCDGKPLTPRTGFAVEINALWYNALRYAVSLLQKVDPNNEDIQRWSDVADKVLASFTPCFYDSVNDTFFDYVNENERNAMVRPNMLIAISLPYCPFKNELKKKVFDIVRSELLTIRGLRSLSPRSPEYKGVTIGNHREREIAYHQGTVFPWLVMPYADASVILYDKTALPYIEDLYHGFEDAIKDCGIGSISEIYDGNPPHDARGCISQSTSVAALLYLDYLIDQMRKDEI